MEKRKIETTREEKRRMKRRTAGAGSGDEEVNSEDAEYVLSDDGLLRRVVPYYFTFTVWVKERWVGKPVAEAMHAEFPFRPLEYYAQAVRDGRITVDGKNVGSHGAAQRVGDGGDGGGGGGDGDDQRRAAVAAAPAGGVALDLGPVLALGQVVAHTNHVHEPPVLSMLPVLVAEESEIVAVVKPPSVPVHPSGRYRHNTLLALLKLVKLSGKLYPVHRLDRLTGGLILLAKTKEAANKMSAVIQSRDVKKEYLARVKGRFLDLPVGSMHLCTAPIACLDIRRGIMGVRDDGKESATEITVLGHTVFHPSGEEDQEENSQSPPPIVHTVLRCVPLTGRTHQIRVHLSHLGHPIANDLDYGGDLITTPSGTYIALRTHVPEVAQSDAPAGDAPIAAEENHQKSEDGAATGGAEKKDTITPGKRQTIEVVTGKGDKYLQEKQRVEGCEICDTHAFFDPAISPATEIWLFSQRYTGPTWSYEIPQLPLWAQLP